MRFRRSAAHPRRTRALVALAGLLGSLAAGVAVAPGASAEEVYSVPSSGSFAIDGHGWGHGHGLSQYGAQGGATLGRTADQITGFYYPGTSKTTLGNAYIRVLLQADTGPDTQVLPATGLKVTDLATGASATLPAGPTRWRSVVDSAGLHVQQLVSGVWKAFALGGKTAVVGPVQFGGPAAVRLLYADGTSRDYRGGIRSVRTSVSSVASVNVVPMESYLRGVVPRESSSSWAAAALQAQAIAARSYSAYKRAHAPSGQSFDICDTTQCQVYGGAALYSSSGTRTPLEVTSTDQAVSATAGVVRTYQGSAIFAEFSASNGGWSTDGGLPYLIAQRDDWDGVTGSSVHSWTATLTAAQIQNRFPSVGTLQRLRVTLRDGNGEWGGRVKTVVLEGVTSSGAATSVTTTGAGVYNAHTWPASSDGLRSSWWHIRPSYAAVVTARSTAPSLVQSPGASTGVLAVTLKNTGTQSWPVSGLHLAVASPVGEADPLVGGSTRPGTYTKDITQPGASEVAVGDVAEFRFALTGDGVSPGLLGRSYRLRMGTGALFGPTVSWQVRVSAPLFTATTAAAPSSIGAAPATTGDAPGAVFADGRTVVVPNDGSTGVRLTLKNTGNLAWPVSSTSPVLLGTSKARDRVSPSAGTDWLSNNRPARLVAASAVAPGATGTFDLVLHGANRAAGAAQEAFEPVWERQHWIDGALTDLTVVRVNTHLSRLAEVQTPAPRAFTLYNAPNGTATFAVRMRNLGASAWPVGSELLSTGTASPFATSAWKDTSHPPALYRNASRPSVSAVYPGEIGEWRVPVSAWRKSAGSYTLSLRPSGPSGAYGATTSSAVTVKTATFTAQLVAVRPAPTVPSQGAARTWYDVKNTGNVAWPVGGLVRSASLLGKGSPSHASGWLTLWRPGSLTSNLSRPGATTVAPGEVARFVFYLAGNGRSPGSYSEPFGLVWEGWKSAGLTLTVSYRIG